MPTIVYQTNPKTGVKYAYLSTSYWDKDTNILFAYQEIEGEESSQDMGANPVVQKWWDYMADIMEVNEDNSPVTIPLSERFHMD